MEVGRGKSCINGRCSSHVSDSRAPFQSYLKFQELVSSAVWFFGFSTRLEHQGPIFQHFDGGSKFSDHGSGHLCRAFLFFAADCCDVLGRRPRSHDYWDAGLMVLSIRTKKRGNSLSLMIAFQKNNVFDDWWVVWCSKDALKSWEEGLSRCICQQM